MLVNFRIEESVVEIFDKLAKLHSRDRTGELKDLMLKDIKTEFPDYVPPDGW